MKRLRFFMVALVALATIGCGSSSNDYVYTGNVNPALTGDVTFQFTQAATQALVPAGTTTLNFDFYSEVDADGNPVPPADFVSHGVPYADSVTIEDVPVAASYVVVTAYGDHGIPLATAETPITVYGGQNTNADMTGVPVVSVSATSVTAAPVSVNVGTNTTPVVTATFDNGETVTPLHFSLFNVAGNDATVATYADATGLFTGVAAGNTTYTATFGGITSAGANVTVGTVTPPTPTAQLVVVSPTSFAMTRDQWTSPMRDVVSAQLVVGNVRTDVTAAVGFGPLVNEGGANAFFLDDDSEVYCAVHAAYTDTATLPVYYNHNGTVLTANITFTVAPDGTIPTVTGMQFLPSSIINPLAGPPAWDELDFRGILSNGTLGATYLLLNGDAQTAWAGSTLSMTSSDTSVATISAPNVDGGGTVYSVADGTTTISMMNGSTVVDSYTLTVETP